MARPLKRSCDYYPHSAQERNTPESRALRARFGLEGYAIFAMVMELLCGADDFCAAWDELNIELLSGDFGITAERLTEVVNYMQRLKLVEIDGEILRSSRLETMLQPVIEKRLKMQAKNISATTNIVTAAETPNTDAETTQRKGKERKGEERKEIIPTQKEIVAAENEKTDTPADDELQEHAAVQKLITWAPDHQQWLRDPIKDFQVKKHELTDGSVTGELRKFARYYLYKSKPHVSARFEHDPVDFLRASWRDWISNIATRRSEKTPTPTPKGNAAPVFSPEEAYAIAYGVCGEAANEFGKRMYRVQTAADRTEARERAQQIFKEISATGATHTRTGPVSLAGIIN